MLIPVPLKSTPLNLLIRELYLPPDAQEPISISLPCTFFTLKFKFVSTQKPE